MGKNDNYTNVLLEDMNTKFDRIIEVVGSLRDEIQQKADAEAIKSIQDDIKIIKAVVTDTSSTIKNHDNRISQLEFHTT